MIKAIIFDMDGVLIDSETIWSRAEKKFLKSQNLKWKPKLKTRIMGLNEKEACKLLKREYRLKMSTQEIYQERLKILFSFYKKELKYFSQTLSTLKQLKSSGLPLALATSSYQPILKQIKKRLPQFLKYFKLIVTGEQVKRSKPWPDIFLLVAKKLKVKPEDCLVVEDSRNGILSAKRAGMSIIGLKTKQVPVKFLKPADYRVTSLRQIPPLITKINYHE